jgi:hypothetical protein
MSKRAPKESSNQKPFSAQWSEARKLSQRLHFDKLYANWLKARAANEDRDNNTSDVDGIRLSDLEDEAARLLLVTPSVLSWMVWKKIEVFEFYLKSELDSSYTDCRIHAFWGCIKADLARFGIGAPGV